MPRSLNSIDEEYLDDLNSVLSELQSIHQPSTSQSSHQNISSSTRKRHHSNNEAEAASSSHQSDPGQYPLVGSSAMDLTGMQGLSLNPPATKYRKTEPSAAPSHDGAEPSQGHETGFDIQRPLRKTPYNRLNCVRTLRHYVAFYNNNGLVTDDKNKSAIWQGGWSYVPYDFFPSSMIDPYLQQLVNSSSFTIDKIGVKITNIVPMTQAAQNSGGVVQLVTTGNSLPYLEVFVDHEFNIPLWQTSPAKLLPKNKMRVGNDMGRDSCTLPHYTPDNLYGWLSIICRGWSGVNSQGSITPGDITGNKSIIEPMNCNGYRTVTPGSNFEWTHTFGGQHQQWSLPFARFSDSPNTDIGNILPVNNVYAQTGTPRVKNDSIATQDLVTANEEGSASIVPKTQPGKPNNRAWDYTPMKSAPLILIKPCPFFAGEKAEEVAIQALFTYFSIAKCFHITLVNAPGIFGVTKTNSDIFLNNMAPGYSNKFPTVFPAGLNNYHHMQGNVILNDVPTGSGYDILANTIN